MKDKIILKFKDRSGNCSLKYHKIITKKSFKCLNEDCPYLNKCKLEVFEDE